MCHRPHKASQFPGHRANDLALGLAFSQKFPVFLVQAPLRPLSQMNDLLGASLPPILDRLAGLGRIPLAPGTLHQDSPKMGIPGLGDSSLSLFPSGRVLTAGQTGKVHEGRGLVKASEFLHLDHQGYGRQGVDPLETPQIRHGSLVGRFLGQLFDLCGQTFRRSLVSSTAR